MAEIEVLETDITELEVDAISNAANTKLIHGRGVATAIARAGGAALERESRERGVGGFPIEEAARIEVEEVRSHLADTTALERVVFAVRGGAAREAFERPLER